MKKKVNLDQQKKSKNGNSFEKQVISALRDKRDEFEISKLVAKKRFYYKQLKVSEIITNLIKDECEGLSEAQVKRRIDKAVKEYFKNSTELFRTKVKNYKEADISFETNNKYFYDGKSTKIKFIIDTTTSARTDRIKGKAQDSSVYKSLGLSYIYLIVLPDDKSFNEYKNPKMEKKLCENAVYDANFGRVYEKENVSLIIRQKDLKSLLTFVNKNKGKDIHKIITSWKNKYYSKMKVRQKDEENKNIEMISDEVFKLLKK